MLSVEVIEGFYIGLHVSVNRILQKLPLKALIFIPLVNLAELLSHKQELLARMTHHKAVGSPKVRKLRLKGISRHLSRHGTLAVDHLVVGEYQDEILAVGINHAEGQLPVMVAAEVGIALHVSEEVVHPPHIPLIVKAKAVLLHRTCHLRPGCGFLGNKHSAVLPSLEHRV